jgi:hypothetical protein
VRVAKPDLFLALVLGMAASVWCATYGKVPAMICQGPTSNCPKAHVAWGWTIGVGVGVAALAAWCLTAWRRQRMKRGIR